MTVSAPAGWYPDPDAPGALRWWDGAAWTGHVAHGPPAGSVKVKPGLVPVWITAVLSLFVFWVRTNDGRSVTTIVLPVGIVFMAVCWVLIGHARRFARDHHLALSGAYKAAGITASVLAGVSVLNSLRGILNG